MHRSVQVAALVVVLAAGAWLLLARRDAALGPTEGFDLPPADTGRVGVGDRAPDFTLLSREGERITLSEVWRDKDVVLVFYRGHW